MFQNLLPVEFVDQSQANSGVRRNASLYTPRVVLWLLVAQRLAGGAPLETAVLELLRGLPASFWPRPCKRVRQWLQQDRAPSSHTGAYNQARQALPLSVVEQSCDHIFEQLVARMDEGGEEGARTFVLDGSTIRMAHTPVLREHYPPGSNQYGEGHWPLLRVLVAHDLRTGLAVRPEWGPVHGGEAVSEQGLLEKMLSRLPKGSTVMGDANFGVFSVAYAATQGGHATLLRLTKERARRLAGGSLADGLHRRICWRPSADDRRSHPELPSEACVEGRLMVCQVQPNNGAEPFLLAVFTTLESPEQEVLEQYGERWSIETDLRTLKSTLHLDQLTCTSPNMVAKEIDMGIAAYNLVRAIIGLAAEQSGIDPRRYSFTKVRRIFQTFGPVLANAATPQEAQRIFNQMMCYVQQAKRPRRQRSSYPRAVWRRSGDFPKRKA